MTPPNKLEQLAEFQDAIQSNKGLERLRAMQYLQQMNNQGIMGLPQVQQQPVVQRQEPGSIGSGLSNSGLENPEALREAAQSGLSGGRKVFNNLDEATAANLPPNSEFFIVDDPDLYFVDATGAIGKEVQEGTAGGIDAYTAEDIEDGTVTEEKAIAYRNYLRDLEQSNQDRSQFDRRKIAEQGGLDWVANANGGPVIERFNGGLTDLRGANRLANEVNYVEEVDPMGSPQAMNDQIVNTQGENIPFNFGAARFISNAGGPIPLRENTQEGIRERATLGGVVDPNFVSLNTAPNPNFFRGVGYKNLIKPESVQPVNLPIQSQDVTNTFISDATPDGSLGPISPPMVEYTPNFIGGGMIPQPRMVPADEQGNPIIPSKRPLSIGPFQKVPGVNFPGGPYPIGSEPGSPWAMGNQGGYIIDLEGNIPTHPAFHGGPIIPRNQGGYVLDLANGGPIDPTEAAQGLASFGRHGDSMLVHMNPEEVEGLMSLGKVTYNPITGLPEAWGFGSVFKAIKNIGKSVAKGVKGIVKSKTFKMLAPLVLAVAAPYALGALAPSVFGATGATFMGGALSTSGALGYGLATGLGSMAGNLLGGARFGDAARQGLLSGATGGIFKGIGSGNWMGTGTGGVPLSQLSKVTQVGPGGKTNIVAGIKGPPQGIGGQGRVGFGLAAQPTVQAPSTIGTNILKGPVYGSPPEYTGTGLQSTVTPEGLSTGAVQNIPTAEFSNIQYETVGRPMAPEATHQGFFGQGPLSPTGGSPAPGTGSTWDQVKGIGRDIYKDYGNWQGAAKLVGMDMMQPDWDQVYASEDAMEQQLRDMNYTIDTGFDGQRVIRDSSGTVMPSSLSIQDILDRALGRTPRTRLADRIGFEPNVAAQGGLVSLADGGEFSGKVEGRGHGMEDNVYMPIKEKGHGKQIGTLAVSPSEYVVDAHTMSALGNGNPDAGAEVMDTVIESVRKKAYGTVKQPNEINGLNALMPMMQGV
jgi:hypothetical protein